MQRWEPPGITTARCIDDPVCTLALTKMVAAVSAVRTWLLQAVSDGQVTLMCAKIGCYTVFELALSE
jgi:hypothetical protein